MHYKGFKVRIYPTREQEILLWEHIGSCRYIWNYMLDLQQKLYDDTGGHLSAFSMMNLLKPLKNDGIHEWLYNVSNSSLKIVCQDLDNAYSRFFRNISGKPKYKSKKKSKQSYPVCVEKFYICDKKYMQIQKLGKVRYKTDLEVPIGKGICKFVNVRISYNNFKWFVSFSILCDNQVHELTDKLVGIDLGIKELAVVAVDEKKIVFHNINKSRTVRGIEKRIKSINRSISRKYRSNKVGDEYVKTNNIRKLEDKVAKLYQHLSGIRKNYINHITHYIVSLLPSRVAMEDLNVLGLMKNRHMSKAIQDECFYEFSRQMRYKCEWNGIEFVKANRFYPSSKTCSECGFVDRTLTLKDRIFVCPKCGLKIDRDFNAALNLSRYIA